MPRAALAAVVSATALAATPSAGASAGPSVTLLTPANGAVVYSTATTVPPTFSWHVDWATPQETMIVWEIAADPGFTTNAMSESHFCSAATVNCWTSHKPERVWGPPFGSVWYWRVGVSAPGGMVYSPTWKFRAVEPGDRDNDGVPTSATTAPAPRTAASATRTATAGATRASRTSSGRGSTSSPARPVAGGARM